MTETKRENWASREEDIDGSSDGRDIDRGRERKGAASQSERRSNSFSQFDLQMR